MRVGRARHGNAVCNVLQTVLRFVLDGRTCRFLVHVSREAAALDHESVDDTMKDGAVVVTVFDILQKIGNGFRRGFGVKFQRDGTEVGLQFDHGDLSFGDGSGFVGGGAGKACQGGGECEQYQ